MSGPDERAAAPAPTPADGPGAVAATPVDPVATPVDVGRRQFFRRLAGDLVQTAGSLTGVATIAQGAVSGATAAARELEADAVREGTPVAGPTDATAGTVRPPSMEHLASRHLDAADQPWSWEGDRLLLLDQRRLPAVSSAFPVTSAGTAARAIADRVVTGPSAAATAAWGLAFAAAAAAGREPATAAALVAGARTSLLAADPGSYVLRRTVATLMAAIATGSRDAPGDAPAAARAAADAVASGFREEHRALSDRVAALLSDLGTRAPLLHGSSGALWGAGAGIGSGALVLARDAGAALLPHVTEARPWLVGARITAWELGRLGFAPVLLPDAGAAGAMAVGRIDLVLCVAERRAADGSLSVPLGAFGLALAAAHAGIPFVVALPAWALDPDGAADAAALAEPPVPETVLTTIAGSRIAPPGVDVDATRFDIVPPALVTHLVTAAAPIEERL